MFRLPSLFASNALKTAWISRFRFLPFAAAGYFAAADLAAAAVATMLADGAADVRGAREARAEGVQRILYRRPRAAVGEIGAARSPLSLPRAGDAAFRC